MTETSTTTSQSVMSPQGIRWLRIGLAIVAFPILISILLWFAQEFSLIQPYFFNRGDFIRTTGVVTDIEESGPSLTRFAVQTSEVTYQFQRGQNNIFTISRTITGNADIFQVGMPVSINFFKEDPEISYLREEEPFIISVGWRLAILALCAIAIFQGLRPRKHSKVGSS